MPKAWEVRFHLRTVVIPVDNVVSTREQAARSAINYMKAVHPAESVEIQGIEETEVEGTTICDTLIGGGKSVCVG